MALIGTINSPNDFGLKNRIINGAMVIDQRNAGASVTVSGTGQYVLDRWRFRAFGGGQFSAQQSTTAPAGFYNSVACTVTTADSSIASGDNYYFFQEIEGYNIANLDFGTANAQTITISFWVRSSVTGTYSVFLSNGQTYDRGYVATYTINAANTYEYKTVTIAGDTIGTWGKTNGGGLSVGFNLGAGTDYQTTAGSWVNSFRQATSGTTQWIATNGATFFITGVQVEKGSTATSFDYRDYGRELQLCHRYYYQTPNFANGAQIWGISGTIATGTTSYHRIAIPTVMRTTPSIALSPAYNTGGGWNINLSSITNSTFTAAPTIADYLNGTMVAFYAPITNIGSSYHCLNTDIYVPTGVSTNNIQLSAEL
jgi:hypothetical protein